MFATDLFNQLDNKNIHPTVILYAKTIEKYELYFIESHERVLTCTKLIDGILRCCYNERLYSTAYSVEINNLIGLNGYEEHFILQANLNPYAVGKILNFYCNKGFLVKEFNELIKQQNEVDLAFHLCKYC